MYTDVSTNEYFTESPKHPYSEQFSAVNHSRPTTPKSREVYLEFLTPSPSYRPHQIPLKPKFEHWPPLVTETPEVTKGSNEFSTAILSFVVVVAVFWIGVTGIVIRNKIRAKRERRRAEEAPSYSTTLFSSNSALSLGSNTGINQSFGPREMSDFTVIDISLPADGSSSLGHQTSAPSQTTAENFPAEPPPSYEEIQGENSYTFKCNPEEQPPSYLEAQLQRRMQESGS